MSQDILLPVLSNGKIAPKTVNFDTTDFAFSSHPYVFGANNASVEVGDGRVTTYEATTR